MPRKLREPLPSRATKTASRCSPSGSPLTARGWIAASSAWRIPASTLRRSATTSTAEAYPSRWRIRSARERAFKTSANKTDPTDAQQIAEYAYRYEDKLRFWEPPKAIVEHVRVLLRAREQFSRDLVAKKNLLKTMHRKAVRTPFAEEMLEASIRELKAKTRRIRDEIWRLVRTDRQLTETMMLLRSIPGVGPVLSAHLLVTTNAFQRTPTSRQLAAFIGICPYEHQSGTSVQKKATSRRYGPPILRKLLYLAALTLKKYVPRFEHYYLRKRAEGKPPKLILNNVANKLVRIICAVLRDRQPYYETHRSVNPNLLQAG